MRIVDYDKIKERLEMVAKNNEVMLVLKDNAYGFGIDNMVRLSKELGIKSFAVKSIEEGIEIRRLDRDCDILILGKVRKDLSLLKQYNLIGTINDYDDYLQFKENKVRAHLGIDLGMNRFGMKNGYLALINDVMIEAIYTHIYKEESALEKIEFIENLAFKYGKKYHVGGSVAYNKSTGMLRLARIIYEYSTKLYKEIVNIKEVYANEGVGYDSLYTAKTKEKIAICNFGYADGLHLHYNGNVFINGKIYQVVGRCCMDQCFIRVGNEAKIGDLVEFYGDNISEDYFCEKNNMTKYELFLQIK